MIATLPTSVPVPDRHNATIVSVHDGDTINVVVEPYKDHYVGSPTKPHPVRLVGCNAIELGNPGGPETQAWLASLLPVGATVVLYQVGDDKFAPRWDCSVAYVPTTAAKGSGIVHDLVTDLVADGWVVPWNGLGVKPVPPWPRVQVATVHEVRTRMMALGTAVREWQSVP